jgi:hypothetical protein
MVLKKLALRSLSQPRLSLANLLTVKERGGGHLHQPTLVCMHVTSRERC